MSWFDATGLANIAKSALKGAQKTIDKALDIRDDDLSENEDSQEKASQGGGESDFFASWGLNEKKKSNELAQQNLKHAKNSESTTLKTSTWGSFSGSFFQVDGCQTENKNSILISTQPQKFKLTLCNEKDGGLAPLASPEHELTPVEGILLEKQNANNVRITDDNESNEISQKDGDVERLTNSGHYSHGLDSSGTYVLEEANVTIKKNGEENTSSPLDERVTTRQKVRSNSNRNSYIINRLSVVSTDSEGKKSCDSVEILTSLSCATSPETDLPSVSTSSSMGLPVSSSGTDSVEVINALGSPSSVEVIDSHCSERSTQSPDENSPREELSVNQCSKELIMISSPKDSSTDVSPESVEVLPDLNEFDDELSVGDSYTSASESTGATILEPTYQFSYRTTGSFTDVSAASSKFRSGESTPDVLGKMTMTNKSSSDLLSQSIHEIYSYDVSGSSQIKSDEARKIHRDLEYSNREILSDCNSGRSKSVQGSPTRKTMPKSEDKSTFRLEEVRVQKLDLGTDLLKGQSKMDDDSLYIMASDRSDSLSLDEVCGSTSSHSDSKTVVANDSSREGTLMESSAEDGTSLKLKEDMQECVENLDHGDRKSQQMRNPSSFYVKNLLAEALGEDSATRETSPTLSEKSRSDFVKVGSEQTSEHTSGDELETTTSSDIEIISRYSPNGDSSSTTSRHSPAKLFHSAKGKLSLVAVDILGKVTQPKMKGHQREPSEASSFCSEDNSVELDKLTKRISELSEILADRESKLLDLSKSNVEMRERNQELKQKVEQSKLEAEARLSSGLPDAEKDELIRQLREEGDKLSKKELKQANLIKTLRAQEKSQQSAIDKYKTEIQNLTQELEKLRSRLTEKEEIEKFQIENFNQLTNKINRQDKEIANLLDEMEKAVVKAKQLKLSLDTAEMELGAYKEKFGNLESELQMERSIVEMKEKKLNLLESSQSKIEMELEYLRQQLKKSEELHAEREICTREEKSNLMRRLQEAERRNEELTQSVSHATKPLLRQMEALQATIAHERETWEKQERNIIQKLDETEMNLWGAQYQKKIYKQEVMELRLKVSGLEQQLQGTSTDSTVTKEQIETLELQLEAVKKDYENEKQNSEKLKEKMVSETNDLKSQILTLERQLVAERNTLEMEKKKVNALQEQLKEREGQHVQRGDSNSPRSSPTLSFGRASLSESISGNWQQFPDDTFETFSTSGRCSNVYDNLRMGNATSLIEGLQSQLKMREGELGQLQWELQKRDMDRAALTNELSTLTTKVEELENVVRDRESIEKSLKELQTNYDALLEMYGEKVEEADELRMDLADVKDMYKTQIDQLLKSQNQNLQL